MTGEVTYSIRADIAVIEIDNPPVNALSTAVRAGLVAAIARFEADPAALAALIIGKGRSFSAGADIREFGAPPAEPYLPDVCAVIEAASKPVVACIGGTALGGGFEIALAAHGRLALEGARVGLPEIKIGLMPGAGGTQRLPRLVGAERALEIMLSGAPVTLRAGQTLGLVDGIVGGDLISAGRELGLRLAQGPLPRLSTERGQFADGRAYQATIEEARSAVETRAARAIIDAVEAAPLLPIEAALALERDLFTELKATDEADALRHAFLATRAAAKPPRAAAAPPLPLRVGLVGGGLMGAGIAVACLDAGYPVTLVERDAASAARAGARIEGIYARAVARGRMDAATREGRLAQLTLTSELGELSDADLIIEAGPEDTSLKEDILDRLRHVARPDAILASNTSYLDLEDLAGASGRPERMIGLHFFAPAHVMPLVEIGIGDATAAEVEAAAFAFAASLRKNPVPARATPGLIGNRVLTAYRAAADMLVASGASPYEVDAAVRGYGFALGPFEALDLSGLDISAAFRQSFAKARLTRPFDLAATLMARGDLGQKTGRGFYIYNDPKSPRAPRPDPDLAAHVAQERAVQGFTPGKVSAEHIRETCLLAMLAEGGRLLDEGVAARPGDIDVVMLLGFGFPRHKGGPMKAAEQRGLLSCLRKLEARAAEDPFWTPPEALRAAVKAGNRF